MPKWYCSKKFYKNWFFRKIICVSRMFVDYLDSFKDKKICGFSLSKYVPSIANGSTGSQSTPYLVLDKIFKDVELHQGESFIDIGCGKGRVLAYMVRRQFPVKLNGVELNEEVAEIGQKWAKRYDNVSIICCSAFDIDYNDYDILFMGRPFEPEMFYEFIKKLEQELKHPITLYYWVEQQSGSYLDDRSNWKLIKRDTIFFRKGLFLAMSPQRYSIWEFTP